MTTQDNIVEALHRAIELKLELSSILITDFFRSLHRAHLVDPVGHCLQPLVVCGQIGVGCQRLLDVSQCWKQVVHRFDIQCKHINWSNKLGSDVEDALCKVAVGLLAPIVRLLAFEELLGGGAVLDIVLLDECVDACEVLDGVRTELVLVQQ